MKDDRLSTVAPGSFNTNTNQVNDSYNDNSKNTDNRHIGDIINNQSSSSTASVRGLDILKENAVPGAAYDSSECQSTPVCPMTRIIVLDLVAKWADARNDSAICWMHGPAGIGKTSLATSIAMKYAEEKRLAGSFFFTRDPAYDAGRRSVHKVFATIAYQISRSHPSAKRKLRDVMNKDPLILKNSLEHQFSDLIIGPFQPVRFNRRFFVTLCLFIEVVVFFLAYVMFHQSLDVLLRLFFQITMAVIAMAVSPITPRAFRECMKILKYHLPMIVVIDALDECSEDVVTLITVLAHVYRDSPPPIRFFVTSRPEDHIRGKFRISSYSQRTHFIDLLNFQAEDDIRIFLQVGFSALYTELKDYMRGVGTPWPSDDDLETVVEKSEGLFIYASTLLKFVGDVEDQGQGLPKEKLKKSLPQERLKKAIEQHNGLDGLYRQVLGDAPFRSDPNFDILLGAMCFLYDRLGMDNLTDLLQFDGTDETRLLLRGCRSILRIPESDADEISFFHASLRDFLTDKSRSRKEYFLDPVIQHIRLLDHCIRAIATSPVAPKQDTKPSISYAWKNWHRHLHAALRSSNAVRRLKARRGERFEARLVHFLDTVVSESSNLCDTWRLLLQQRAIEQHDGLDGLYLEVLGDAPFRSDPNYDVLLGAICFQHDPLGMDDLTDLLQFNGTDEARLLLRGCRSILRIPESDTDEISFLHASLRDFLTNESRSGEEYFLDPVIQHIRLLGHCIRAIATSPVAPKQDIKPSIAYAWKNWYRHLHAALQSSDEARRIKLRLGERFEPHLAHLLDSIISESSNLCDIWQLLLRKKTIGQHDSLDGLYREVLGNAPFRSHPNFDVLLGTMCFLYDPVGLDVLTDLLQLNGTNETRLALRGCRSILRMPESDTNEISFFHSSLREFLTDRSRAWEKYFLDPVIQHIRLLGHCIRVTTLGGVAPKKDIKPSGSISYAWKNWHRHLHAALQDSSAIHHLKAHLGERFEAGLVHFLDPIVSESSNLCHTWDLLLLKRAIDQHDGLDNLYRKVLRDAPFRSDPKFDILWGAMCFLYDPLGMDDLTDLLQFKSTDETRLLLRGCRSIVRIPESYTDNISFLHSSLCDFLTDRSRSQEEYFLDPLIQHTRLLDHCIRALTTIPVGPKQGIKPSISYAWKNWHRHLHAALQSSNAVHHLKAHLGGRFEGDLMHLLDSNISEPSSSSCNTWEVLLLRRVIEQHNDLDGLYRQVLGIAPFRSQPKFDELLGAMCFLYDPLGMDVLADLLQFNGTDETRLLLRGCTSIVQVPERDTDEIPFFHASLLDYLTHKTRSLEECFLDPVIQHIRILGDCIRVTTPRGVPPKQDIKSSISYAWRNWHRHLHAALQSSNAIHYLKAHLGERFEADLIHFLDPIVSESSNLCKTWELLLQKRAIDQHDGLDNLYRQVLRDAPFRSDPKFDILWGAMGFLYDPLGMDDLTDLLHFNGTDETRLLLRGCRSILRIPESDTDEISFFHESLWDFLTDKSRSREAYFLDPVIQHTCLLDHCIRAITTTGVAPNKDIKPSISYAWKNWHRHLYAALQSSNAVHRLKAHLGERFDAGLVHFLDSLVSESSSLSDMWELVLQNRRVSWMEIAPVLEDMVQVTKPLFPISKLLKMVKFLARHSTLHWRTTRVIFDQINDNLNITLVGVEETQIDLNQLFTHLTPKKTTAKLPSPQSTVSKYLQVYTAVDKATKKLRRPVNIAFTLSTATAESNQRSDSIVLWKTLRFEKEATILRRVFWSRQSGLCSFDMASHGTLIPIHELFLGGLGEAGELDGGLDEPKRDIFIYGVPVMLQAYIIPDKPGYEERQLVDVSGLYPLLENGAIDISKLADRFSLILYEDRKYKRKRKVPEVRRGGGEGNENNTSAGPVPSK